MSEEAQELHCHNCDRYVQFKLDLSVNGNYVLNCPNCGHEHYRVVENGRITESRWGQDPSQVQQSGVSVMWQNLTAAGTTATSVYGTSGSSNDLFIHQAWNNSTTSSAFGN